MKIKYKANKYFQIENKIWLDYLINQEKFKPMKGSKEKLVNSCSYFSSHPESIQIHIDLSHFPEIGVEAKNCFFPHAQLQKISQDWIEKIEERLFAYSQGQALMKYPKPSYLLEKSIGGVSELFSHLFLPSLAVIVSAFVCYVLICFNVIKTIATEMKYDYHNPQTYLSFAQLSPDEISFYSSNADFLNAAILLALLGGGFFFGVQQLLICLTVKFWSGFIYNKIALLILLGGLQGVLYFMPTISSNWLVFIPVSFLSYFLFSFFTRRVPFNLPKRLL